MTQTAFCCRFLLAALLHLVQDCVSGEGFCLYGDGFRHLIQIFHKQVFAFARPHDIEICGKPRKLVRYITDDLYRLIGGIDRIPVPAAECFLFENFHPALPPPLPKNFRVSWYDYMIVRLNHDSLKVFIPVRIAGIQLFNMAQLYNNPIELSAFWYTLHFYGYNLYASVINRTLLVFDSVLDLDIVHHKSLIQSHLHRLQTVLLVSSLSL